MTPTAAIRDRSSITDTKQAPRKTTSHSSTAQMDVPHTHGAACWWCCWALVFLRCALCVLTVLMAVLMRAQNTDRMLPVVRAHDLHIFLRFASKPYVRMVTGIGDADVAETRGFVLPMPKVKKVLKACHARHTARTAPEPPATRPQGSNCVHPI